MTLKYPYLLLLLLIYIPLIWYWIYSRKSHFPTLKVSSLRGFTDKHTSGRAVLIPVCRGLQLVAIGCLIVALARPQAHDRLTSNQILGTDIVLALDISESMNTADISPTRFEAAKSTAIDFIKKRTQDNIGLVTFAGEAISVMPLTNDLFALQNAVRNVKMGELADGTAIGDGLVSAINRVLNGQAASKSIILLTDGTNNRGKVAPSTAAEIAAKKGIRVYTIGVGKDGESVYIDPYGMARTVINTPIDEETLSEIARETDGKYFRVTELNTLKRVFKEIDSLEKTRMDTQSFQRTDELFMPWVLAALCCFVISLLLRFTLLTKIP